MTLPGSQAALRGYRLQHLYTLYRLFGAGADDLVIHLEGTEDVDILDRSGNLIEAIQVKALKENLTASSLHSAEDSFFCRANERLAKHPKSLQKVVSFGPFGPALSGAQKKGSQDRAKLKEYVRQTGLNSKQIERVLNALRLETVAAEDLTANVMERLKDTIAGADPEVAFTFLSGWLFCAMEEKAQVTAHDLEQRLLAIGKYVTEAALKRHEWNVNIVPLVEPAADDATRMRLSDEFYRGTYTRYEHVVADLDVKRNRKLGQIDEAFARKNAVVVHGASGQGKTSLAYRYMRDRAVGLCVEVRLLEDATHALRVAQVLAAHAKAMGTRMVAYIDVAPRNLNWRSLIRELAGISNIRLLITVREEDWARARSEGMQFEVADVELGFEQNEARDLFEALVQKKPPSRVLNFEEAWAKFGEAGPLMEFAYLVTQSEALRERLDAQVRRLREEVRTANDSQTTGKVTKSELELLRRVAVASGYGARLSIDRLDDELQLPDFTATLSLFEREYLLRRSGDGRFLEGLHPIRSEILAELLTKDEVRATWARTACACLQAIHEPDIYGFLLHSFTRRERDAGELLNALDRYQPTTWTGLAGTFRALLWFGLNDFARACKPVIDEANAKLADGAWILIPLDPANIGARWPSALPRMEEGGLFPDSVKPIFEQLRRRIPNRKIVTEHARRWILAQNHINAPKLEADWRGAAEVTFWTAYWGIWHETKARLSSLQVQDGLLELPLPIAADIWLAWSFVGGSELEAAMPCQTMLLDRYRQEMLVPLVEDNGETAKAHFIVQISSLMIDDASTQKKARSTGSPFHEAATRQVELLRGIVPTRSTYGTQGYGHMLSTLPIPHDETVRAIDTNHFCPKWLPNVNGALTAMIQNSERLGDWDEYARAIYNMRRTVVEQLRKLLGALTKYFRTRQITNVLSSYSSFGELEKMGELLKERPRLPHAADNELGVREVNVSDGLKPSRASELLDASFREYTRTLGNFYEQAGIPLAINPHFGRIKDLDRNENAIAVATQHNRAKQNHLSVVNLYDAIVHLPHFQRLFREQFTIYHKQDELSALESQEADTMLSLWLLWYQFAFHPRKVSASIGEEARDAFERPIAEARRHLRKSFKAFAAHEARATILSETVETEDRRTLWLSIDVDNPLQLESSVDSVLRALHAAMPSISDRVELKHYSYRYFWSHVHIVPLFRGKAIDREMWQFSWSAIPRPSDEPGLLARKLWPREIPENTCNQLGIQFWRLERISKAQQFKASYLAMRFLLEHIVSLAQLPEQDALGEQIVKDYVKNQWTKVVDACDRLNAILLEMFRHSEASNASTTDLIESLRAMIALMPLLKVESRQVMEGLEVEALRSWCESLEAILPQVEAVRLAWIGDVLDEEAARG